MFTLIKMISTRELLLQQAPSLTASFLIANVFYKFGSFALECVAFLGTWYVLDAAVNLVRGKFSNEA
jgi:hypothetical protein